MNMVRTKNQVRGKRLSIELLEDRRVLSATFQDAGIEQVAIDAIHASQYASTILAEETLQNALDAIAATEAAPADATVLTSVADLAQITAGTVSNPNVYLIQGDLTITSNIEVPSNVHIYVDGSIFKRGDFIATGGIHGLPSNNDDAIFMVDGTDNIRLVGIDNALLHSNPDLNHLQPHTSGVFIAAGSDNVEVNGFKIANTFEALVARGTTNNVQFLNNYVQNTLKRAIHSIASNNLIAAHNFIVNPGVDGLDWDAFTNAAIGYENVVIGAGRWAGFVEEAAHDSYLIRGLALMVDLGNPNRGFMLGWSDNGTTFSDPLTRDNYIIDNVIFNPGNIPQSVGDYQANANVGGKGTTYFWANRGFGAGQSTTLFDNAEWLDFLPTAGGKNNSVNAVQLLADLDAQFNVATPGDFNNDDFVDGDDLLQWQGDYGQNADSDADQDGDTDGRDFLSWQINYSPAPPPMDLIVTVLDTDYTSSQGFGSGNLAGQQGWVGQAIAQVDASGSGTVTSVGGPYDRNMYNTGARGGNGSSPSSLGFNDGDQLEITFDYQFNLPSNSNIDMANVGIRDEGPMASNNWEARPLEGFKFQYNTSSGGELRIYPDLADSNPADALVVSAAEVGISAADLVSDDLQVYYQIRTDGAGTWTVLDLTLENLSTGSSYTYSGPTQTFNYSATDAFFAQMLAPNNNAAFSGVTDGVKFVFVDPVDAPLSARQEFDQRPSRDQSLVAVLAIGRRDELGDDESPVEFSDVAFQPISSRVTKAEGGNSAPALREEERVIAKEDSRHEAFEALEDADLRMLELL